MKSLKTIAVFIVLLAVTFCGCSLTAQYSVTMGVADIASEKIAQGAEYIAFDPTKYNIHVTEAFGDDNIKEDITFCVGNLGFYRTDGENIEVTIMALEDFEPVSKLKLPRTHYYEQFTLEEAKFVFDLVDYAITNGYTRIAFAKNNFSYEELYSARDFMERTYIINGGDYYDTGIKTVLTKQIYDKGNKFYFNLITLTGFENFDTEKFFGGIDEAKRIVDGMPEGYGELEKITYLYSYLAKTVEYDINDYYGIETEGKEWNLLYDTLIEHKTVCAGYAEALYYMCSYANIDCLLVDGWMNDVYNMHAWNIACIDGTYYYFDATWDAGVYPDYYRYFGVSRENLNREIYHHFAISRNSEMVLPACEENIEPSSWALYY